MFRDESSHVIRKAKARARRRANIGIERSATPSDSDGRLSATPEPRGKSLSLVVPPASVPNSPASRGGARHQNDGSMLMSPDSGSWPATPEVAQQYTLAPACQERGFAYFFSRYVTTDEMVCHQKFDFLRDVWKPSSSIPERQVDCVLASMTAVGLMGLASTARSRELMDAARKSYGTALRLTNYALQNPAEAVKDSTMLSVLILGVFEMMTENAPRRLTVAAFQNHVNGAVALARMRGPSQFQTRAGRRMFSMLCQRVVISCAQQNIAMPDSLMQLWYEMAKTIELANPDGRLMPLMWQVLQLRCEIRSASLTDPTAIVDRLLALDEEFEKLTTQLPASWQYRVFKVVQDHPAVFGGICHLYSSLYHSHVWNSILTTRVLLLETVTSEISQDVLSLTPRLNSHHYTEVFHKARRKLKRLLHAVTASVPQQLGLINAADGSIGGGDPGSTRIATVEIRETPSPPTSPSTMSSDSGSGMYSPSEPRSHPSGPTILDVTRARDAEEEAERYMLLLSATRAVIWHLFVVGMSTACTKEIRAYAIARLRTLYMETGIRQADAVANLLEEREMGTHEWQDMPAMPEVQPVLPVMGQEYGLGFPPGKDVLKHEFDLVWV